MSHPTASPSVVQSLFNAVRYIIGITAVSAALATVFTLWSPRPTDASWVAQVADVFVPPTPVATLVIPPTPTAVTTAPIIGIVSGHKGNDPGAVCPDGLTEAAVNYDISLRVQAGLQAAGFQVDVLDEFDTRLEGYRALAVVSIHNDSCMYFGDHATGYKVAGAMDTGARDKSTRLVACLTDRYAQATGMTFHYNTVTRDMTQYHGFYEVHSTTPVAIIETGFLNLDRRILTEEPHRVAQGVIDGIICYVRNEPVAAPTTTPATP